MKVLRNTPRQLILDETPWLISIMLVFFILAFVGVGLLIGTEEPFAGAVFSVGGGGMGALALVVFVKRVQVILDRDAATATIRHRSVRRYSEVEHALSEVDGAELDRTTNGEGVAMSRPVLVIGTGMSAGRHPLVAAYSSGDKPARMVTAINTWLAEARSQRN